MNISNTDTGPKSPQVPFGYRKLIPGVDCPRPDDIYASGRHYGQDGVYENGPIYRLIEAPKGFMLIPRSEKPLIGAIVFDSVVGTWVDSNHVVRLEHERHPFAKPLPPEGYEYRETKPGEDRMAYVSNGNGGWKWMKIGLTGDYDGSSIMIVGRIETPPEPRDYTGWGDF